MPPAPVLFGDCCGFFVAAALWACFPTSKSAGIPRPTCKRRIISNENPRFRLSTSDTRSFRKSPWQNRTYILLSINLFIEMPTQSPYSFPFARIACPGSFGVRPRAFYASGIRYFSKTNGPKAWSLELFRIKFQKQFQPMLSFLSIPLCYLPRSFSGTAPVLFGIRGNDCLDLDFPYWHLVILFYNVIIEWYICSI